MEFLNGDAATARIRDLVASAKKIKMAVAFWGRGAMKELALEGRPAEIVCNLKSGGTNPDEISLLMGKVRSVRQCDVLHGKVYLFDRDVVIGSSNVSANGLAFQGAELAGWREANIVTNDPAIYAAAEAWIDALNTREIKDNDLEAAKIAFGKRRAAAPESKSITASLDHALRAHPEAFRDRRIYVCVYDDPHTEKGLAVIKRVRDEQGDRRIDGLEWQVPTDATLICFFVSPRRIVHFDGFWDRPKGEWKRRPNYLMHPLRDLDGFSAATLGSVWQEAVLKFKDADYEGRERDYYNCIELGAFYDRYLSETPRRKKVLSVLDERRRLKDLGGGKFESGYWFRPAKDCEIIRVFDDRDGESIRGGRIVDVREVKRRGQRRKIFAFKDDQSQQGRAAPSRFRQNGWQVAIE